MSLKEAAAACVGSILLAVILIVVDRLGLWGHGRIPYSNAGGCDVWFYFSQIISPQAGHLLAEGTRIISRPLYVFPPHVLRELIPALDPNQAAYFLFLPLATAALYLGLRALFGRATSAAAALLIGTAPLLVNMASGTYVMMGATAYATCMLACLLWTGRLAGERPVAHLVLAFLGGLFFAFAGNANMYSIKFDFTYVLFALPSGSQSLRRLVTLTARAACAFLVGAGAGILFALELSALLGLGFYAPLQQVVAALGGFELIRHPNWEHESVGFALIAVICLLAAWACHRQRAPRTLLIGAVAIGTSAFHLVAFLAFSDINLAYDWWYFALLPLVGLAFCAALADRIEAEPATALLALVATLIGTNLLLSHLHFLKQLFFDDAAFLAYAFIVALAGALALWRGRPGIAGAVAFVALSLQAAHSSIMHQHYFRSYAYVQDLARATEGAVKLILAHAAERPVVWIAEGDNHDLDLSISRSLIRCPYEGSFPDKLPDPKLHWQPPLAPGRTLVLIDGTRSPVSAIQAALARHGMSLDVAASQYFWRIENVTPGVQVTIGTVRTSP